MQSNTDYMPQRGRPPKNLQQKLASSPTSSRVQRILSPNKKERYLKREQLAAVRHQLQKVQAESFVMKLFDRSLDLSKYTDKSSLYPICRAWMNNQPRNNTQSASHHFDHESPTSVERQDNGAEVLAMLERKEQREITELPAPKSTELTLIPKTPKREINKDEILPVKDKEETEEDDKADAKKEVLLDKHLKQWKRVKSDWVQHQKRYQKQRYGINYRIIQELFKP